jgi:hypothetical protein
VIGTTTRVHFVIGTRSEVVVVAAVKAAVLIEQLVWARTTADLTVLSSIEVSAIEVTAGITLNYIIP